MEIRFGVKGNILSEGRYKDWTIIIEEVKEEFQGKSIHHYRVGLWFEEEDRVVEAYDDYYLEYDSLVLNLELDSITDVEWLNGD
jgi:hypothetical protein